MWLLETHFAANERDQIMSLFAFCVQKKIVGENCREKNGNSMKLHDPRLLVFF